MPMKKTTRKTSRSTARGRPRQVWKKELAHREIWQNYTVTVTRARNGRFVSWRKIVHGRPRKAPLRHFAKITYEEHKAPSRPEARAYERYRELYREPKGKALSLYGKVAIKKGRIKIVESRRWELVKGSLTGDEWRNAVGHARERPPRPQANYRKSYAEDVPENCLGANEGEWIDTPTIESK
jgi:hypothetical protein